jgi:hypothetical protein
MLTYEAQVLTVNCYTIRGERRCATACLHGFVKIWLTYADVC